MPPCWMCNTTLVYVRLVSLTDQLPFGQTSSGSGVGGGGRVTVNVICPLLGGMFVVGPDTFWTTIGWPGATFPPLLTHSEVAVTESAVRNAPDTTFPRPAAFHVTVKPDVVDLVMVGSPMKCGQPQGHPGNRSVSP